MTFRRLIIGALAALGLMGIVSPAFGYRDVRFTVSNATSTPFSVEWWPVPVSVNFDFKSASLAPGANTAITGSSDTLDEWDLVSTIRRSWKSQTHTDLNGIINLTVSQSMCLAGRNPSVGTPLVAGGDRWVSTGKDAGWSDHKVCSDTPAGEAFNRDLRAAKIPGLSTKDFKISGFRGSIKRVPDSAAFIEYAVTIAALPALPTFPVSVTVNDPSMGRVVSVGAGNIDCGARCTAQIPDDTPARLHAIAAPGFRVASWSDSCGLTRTDDDCQMRPVFPERTPLARPDFLTTVTFEPIPPQTLSLTTTGAGSGRITSDPTGIDCGPATTCTGQFPTGSTVTLRAFPDSESTFGGWTGPCAGSGDTCTVTMSAAAALSAKFDQRPNVTVATSVTGSGLVRGDDGMYCRVPPNPGHANRCTVSYPRSASITLTAEPVDPSLPFSGWSSGAPGCSTDSRCMPGLWTSIRPVASFTTTPMTVRVTKTGTGSGRVTGPLGLDCGTTCGAPYVGSPLVPLQFTATPDPGSTFTRWDGTCAGTNGTCRTMRTGEAVAVFTKDPPPATMQLVVQRQGDGRGAVTSDPAGVTCGSDCTGAFATGSSVTLQARASGGSTFAGWQGACTGTASACMVAMDASRTAVAVFQPSPIDPGQPPAPGPGPAPAPLVVPEPGPNPPSPDAPVTPAGAPGLRALSVTRRTFRPGQGTVVRYRLDNNADVTMTFTYGKSRRPRYRYVARRGAVGGDAGANAVRIVGRVRNRDVLRGRWTMRVTARNARGASRTVSRVLTVR